MKHLKSKQSESSKENKVNSGSMNHPLLPVDGSRGTVPKTAIAVIKQGRNSIQQVADRQERSSAGTRDQVSGRDLDYSLVVSCC